METSKHIASITIAIILGLISFPVTASEPYGIGARISPGAEVAAPLGLQLFCLANAAHCKSHGSGAVRMDQQLMSIVSAVNTSVNRSIRPKVRPTQVWELGARVGDCKDYALNKRAQLIARGIPAGALRIAIGYTVRGEGHAVLVVRTDAGDIVLDNLTNQIKPIDRTGHRLISMSGGDLRQWHKIG
jgi:predicted transglutaminase-like cysteine proteinase